MNNLSRADLLKTLYALGDDNKAPVSSAVKNDVAACLGFACKQSEPKAEIPEDAEASGQNKTKEHQEKPVQQLSVKNRFWYINFSEPIPNSIDTEAEDDLQPLQPKELPAKKTTPLPYLSLKRRGEWQNLFDVTLKQPIRSKKTDLDQSIKHLAQNKPADKLPKQKRYGFNTPICIVMERTEELRPVWDDMREIWQGVEKLAGRQNLVGYYLPTGINGSFTRLTERTPCHISQLESGALVVYIGAFGALHSGRIAPDWQRHFARQQKRYPCQLYSVCPIENPPFAAMMLSPAPSQPPATVDLIVQAIQRSWLITETQLRYLREETPDATLHTELLAFNHPKIHKDSQWLWHEHTSRLLPNRAEDEQQRVINAIVERACRRWQHSRSHIAMEMEQLLGQLYSGSEEPKLTDYPHIENLAAVSQSLHELQRGRDVHLSLLRSILPDLEVLAQKPALKEWRNVLRVAQEEAKMRGLSLPLGDKGLHSTDKHFAVIRQQSNHLQLVPATGALHPAQKLLALGNQAYCEETNRIIQDSLPLLDTIHITDQGVRYQLASMRKPQWAERCWQDASGLHAAHADGTELQLLPATSHEQPASWQGIHNAWNWAGEYGVDAYGLWAQLPVKGVEFALRWIPPGSFMMGSPENEKGRYANETQHRVTLTQGFWLSETSVTQEQWQAIMGNNPGKPKERRLPVNNVSWDDCQRFIKKLQALVPDFKPELPTEAQWEYACRAGTTTAYWWGDNFDESKANDSVSLQQESTLPQNTFGLRSMSGNVYEWCSDFKSSYPKEAIENPRGGLEGGQRVLRGGSWFNFARNLRSAYRYAYSPDYRIHDIGLRLAGGFDPQAGISDGGLTADRRA